MSPQDQSDWQRSPDLELDLLRQVRRRPPTPDEAAQQMIVAAEQQRRLEQQLLGRQWSYVQQEIQQAQRRQWLWSAEGRSYEQQGYANPSQPPVYPPQPPPLQEGVAPPQVNGFGPLPPSGDPLRVELERLGDNARRARQGSVSPPELRQEEARRALGAALFEAVKSGLLTEARAVTMIVAGGLNDRAMQIDQARAQVTNALAQAVLSAALDRATADTIIALLDRARTVRPEPTDGLARRDDLIYEALILRPCHLPEHEEKHRSMVWVCDAQAATAWSTMLGGLEIDAALLPRSAHLAETGERAACCRRDGNIGTWLRWGTTMGPLYIPAPVKEPA